ncbi:DUF7149 domain-containing protein [Fulvivirga lutea]|uniref:site-specific DNA-methyltransferase (adenine-specific) n=1 Tax=Fulvivirga lutea TaxID=2810512 RepID=A0A974WIR4_9BACT|nr:TaqI-like C-terminal specificity domain-containing protein [Fulvivirga lutea]QSE99196.1 Eco57I restriction-modification methylase domain-containing protein [Fulvivirga lutea]
MAREKKPFITPTQALNKAYRKQKVYSGDIELFRNNLSKLLGELDEQESEEHVKNDVIQFLNDTWYKGDFAINTKDRTDLVIHNEKTTKSTAGVLLEVKKPSNKSEMVSKDKLNAKALQELVLYYLRERIEKENTDIKHLVVTNVYEWFVFDASTFYEAFYKNSALVKEFKQWNAGQKDTTKTELFYKDIAAPAIDKLKEQLTYTWFDFREFEKELKKEGDSTKLISLYKLLSPVHLLKQPFANDSNSLNKQFYHELLHIIGLEETKDKGKKIIQRKEKGKRDSGSLLENAMLIMDERDRLRMLDRPSHFGKNAEEQAYNVGLELCITWVNRVLFLKLLESQLVSYHKGDKTYKFLDSKTIPDYDVLDRLFFGVLARKQQDRHERYKELFAHIPYLNSSLFEPTGLEEVLSISMLSHDTPIEVYSQTVLKDEKGKRIGGKKDPLTYLFEFLEAYDFASEGKEAIQDESKSLINASVLGLIFEKINGYKDGSFYTPGFITMYMCRETIRRAVVQKFNEAKGWALESFEQLYDKIEDKKEANDIINSLKICDPAVGSGHFLVSALNEIIAIKSELRILLDKEGKTLRDYDITIENDELIITDDNGAFFDYTVGSNEKQRVQETLFHEKQTIIENCLFGVDINPNSVKICRLRLWIELLKNAYYINPLSGGDKGVGNPSLRRVPEGREVLQTLPNIDINIKTGNSLISRFDLDTDISEALKKSKWDITTYRNAVNSYKNATSKEDKREFERLIESIKGDFETEIGKKDKRLIRSQKLKGELMKLTQQTDLFGLVGAKKKAWEKEVNDKTKALQKLEQELEEVRSNQIFEDAFEWRFEFPEVLDDAGNFKGFDVVIGNPPYLRVRDDSQSFLAERYLTAENQLDLYHLFIEKSHQILDSKGINSFIVPNAFLANQNTFKLREFILSNFGILSFVDIRDDVFEEASVDVLIYLFSKAKFNGVSINHLGQNQSIIVQNEFNPGSFKTNRGFNFTTTLSPNENTIIQKIESQSINVEDKYDCSSGIKEYQVGKGKPAQTSSQVKNKVFNSFSKVDVTYLPELRGKNLRKYVFSWNNEYISYGSWLAEPRDVKYSLGTRLLIRQIPGKDSLVTSLVKDDFVIDQTAYVLKPKNDAVNPIHDLAIFNSKLIFWYFRNINNEFDDLFPKIKAGEIKALPLIDKTNPLIENKVTQILNDKNENPSRDTLELEKEIDQLVYELYGLTEEEIKIVEGS